MKYELHINDTFETRGDAKGFIARIKPYDNYQIITICAYTVWYYTFAIPLGEFDGYDDMPNIFKHIWVGLLMFLFTYAGLEPMLVE